MTFVGVTKSNVLHRLCCRGVRYNCRPKVLWAQWLKRVNTTYAFWNQLNTPKPMQTRSFNSDQFSRVQMTIFKKVGQYWHKTNVHSALLLLFIAIHIGIGVRPWSVKIYYLFTSFAVTFQHALITWSDTTLKWIWCAVMNRTEIGTFWA